MNNPIVSVGMPVYNGDNYISQAIDSILSQTYKDFELIISDNASTDNTMAICRSYADKDRRICYHRNENNLGAAWNFNQVFYLARGKYFQWACHDDVWTSTLLERYVDVMDRMPEVVLCYSKTLFINEDGNPIRSLIGRPNLEDPSPSQRFRLFLKYHPNECNPVLGLFRAHLLKKTPLMGNYPASDMILLGEIALHGKFFEIPEFLFLRRDHPGTSYRAHPKFEDRAVFMDPTQKGKIQLTTWRWIYEWFKSSFRCPISMFERIRCVLELSKWARRNRVELIDEFKQGAKWLIRNNEYRQMQA